MWTVVQTAEQVTPKVLESVEDIFDGYFANEPKIDWHDFLQRLEVRYELDLGSSMTSEAIKEIKKYVKKLRLENGC